jgi:prepilin signal peptidase PulO-like enzyme (type II secretory pathway)
MITLMIIMVLVVFGLCLGSFINALIWRIHKQQKIRAKKQKTKYSISKGRSMCVNCEHMLAASDLVPVFSWLMLGGRCRYCKKPISWQYPLVELSTAALFILSYIYWPDPLESFQIILFGLWLACLTGLVALVIYDLRWMLLPNRIIFPLYAVAAVIVLVQVLDASSLQPLVQAVYGILIGGGIFYLLFQLSEGRWIGGGDVKLGFFLGALVGGPTHAALLLFIASLMGSVISLPLLATKKASKSTRIPFGPFLIISTIIVQLFGTTIIDWYQNLFLY